VSDIQVLETSELST